MLHAERVHRDRSEQRSNERLYGLVNKPQGHVTSVVAMARTNLKFGSPEWETHMRRSLAQRKRHGENITDIDGLINYIESKGPAKGKVKNGSKQKLIKKKK
jgi:hypothetical protein